MHACAMLQVLCVLPTRALGHVTHVALYAQVCSATCVDKLQLDESVLQCVVLNADSSKAGACMAAAELWWMWGQSQSKANCLQNSMLPAKCGMHPCQCGTSLNDDTEATIWAWYVHGNDLGASLERSHPRGIIGKAGRWDICAQAAAWQGGVCCLQCWAAGSAEDKTSGSTHMKSLCFIGGLLPWWWG
jgi:hypothetical protein